MKKKTVEARHMPDREIAGTTIEQKWMNFLMLLVGFGMIALGVIMPDPPSDPLELWGLRISMIFFGLLPIVCCPRYHISFRYDSIIITVGYLNLIKVRLDRKKITHVGTIEWNPLKHFGGSGIKGGMGPFKGYMCFNILSGSGIEIKTTEKNYVIEMGEMERNRILSLIGDYPMAKDK
ncbi:hypothetical protein KKB99_04125 [bacterium]|nr:hypothetical protein [bacterium]MBU1025180.1 hypothetical protein [bacterium]